MLISPTPLTHILSLSLSLSLSVLELLLEWLACMGMGVCVHDEWSGVHGIDENASPATQGSPRTAEIKRLL